MKSFSFYLNAFSSLLIPVAGIGALAAAPAGAIWSTNAGSNFAVADRANEQVQPKIAPTADGGCYISWFDNAAGGYDVYLQRLDESGREIWAHNGVLVADRSYSSTEDYGLSVDTAGNALLAFNDDDQTNERIVVSKVSPAGALLWGSPGIGVSSASASFVAAPKVVGTTDGDVVVAWSQDSDTVVQKLDANGAALWGANGVILHPAAGNFFLSDLQASDAGTAIVAFIDSPSFSVRHLSAQKLASANGALLWGVNHVHVYDDASGSLQFGNFPYFLSDGAGGAVFDWYTSSPSLQVFVQRVASNGSEVFAHNGVPASTNGSQLRVEPSASYDTATSDIYVFWTETNTLQSQFGVYGQRIDSAGTRQWTSSGKVVVALASPAVLEVTTLPVSSGAVVLWATESAFNDDPLFASRLDSTSAFVWIPTISNVKTSATGTVYLTGARSRLGFSIYAWSDGSSNGDIRAQNVNDDGTLGRTIFSDGFVSGDTTAWSLTQP